MKPSAWISAAPNDGSCGGPGTTVSASARRTSSGAATGSVSAVGRHAGRAQCLGRVLRRPASCGGSLASKESVADRVQHRRCVDLEIRAERLHALEGGRHHRAHLLELLEGVHEQRAVLLVDRHATERTTTEARILEKEIDREVASAVAASALDLHCIPPIEAGARTASASSKGSIGRTSHPSAPGHFASHTSCARSRSTTPPG